jgi:hypothetical protein
MEWYESKVLRPSQSEAAISADVVGRDFAAW